MAEERCPYCHRTPQELGRVPCQGRHTAARNGRTDPLCAEQYVRQGWRALQRLPAVTSPES
jgi:hypothetical protein